MTTIEKITAENVHSTLKKYILADGFTLVLDLKKSHGSRIVDEKTGEEYIDFFTFFASNPIGMNHPGVNNDEFKEEIFEAAIVKPSNSDIYTKFMAEFVETFGQTAKPDYMKHLFFISGGSLAVENGLKVAFDWKVQKNFQKGYKEEKGLQVLHFREAFHGRSGYTMSLILILLRQGISLNLTGRESQIPKFHSRLTKILMQSKPWKQRLSMKYTAQLEIIKMILL